MKSVCPRPLDDGGDMSNECAVETLHKGDLTRVGSCFPPWTREISLASAYLSERLPSQYFSRCNLLPPSSRRIGVVLLNRGYQRKRTHEIEWPKAIHHESECRGLTGLVVPAFVHRSLSFKSKSFGRLGYLGIHLIPQTASLAVTLG
jgi:hypothetical protein